MLVIGGTVGFFHASTFGTPGVIEDGLGFAVNGWINTLHIVVGVFGLFAAGFAARAYSLGAAILFGALAIWGFATGSNDALLDRFPADGAENLAHALLAGLGLAAWLAERPKRERKPTEKSPRDRRRDEKAREDDRRKRDEKKRRRAEKKKKSEEKERQREERRKRDEKRREERRKREAKEADEKSEEAESSRSADESRSRPSESGDDPAARGDEPQTRRGRLSRRRRRPPPPQA